MLVTLTAAAARFTKCNTCASTMASYLMVSPQLHIAYIRWCGLPDWFTADSELKVPQYNPVTIWIILLLYSGKINQIPSNLWLMAHTWWNRTKLLKPLLIVLNRCTITQLLSLLLIHNFFWCCFLSELRGSPIKSRYNINNNQLTPWSRVLQVVS